MSYRDPIESATKARSDAFEVVEYLRGLAQAADHAERIECLEGALSCIGSASAALAEYAYETVEVQPSEWSEEERAYHQESGMSPIRQVLADPAFTIHAGLSTKLHSLGREISAALDAETIPSRFASFDCMTEELAGKVKAACDEGLPAEMDHDGPDEPPNMY